MSKGRDTYEVGYGKPPVHTRFQKGRSGNPTGKRARQPTFEELIAMEVRKKITITENGETRQITKKQAIAMRCVQKAMQGDLKAQKHVAESLRLLETVPIGDQEMVFTLRLEEEDSAARSHDQSSSFLP
jgi:hypothetical protein